MTLSEPSDTHSHYLLQTHTQNLQRVVRHTDANQSPALLLCKHNIIPVHRRVCGAVAFAFRWYEGQEMLSVLVRDRAQCEG